ncbi:MAG: HAD-IA family hydrolase [Acidobacteriota bacterium]
MIIKQTPTIKAVLFDFDATLTLPGSLDFPAIKKALGCPTDLPVLEFIANLACREEQEAALRVLDRFESDASRESRPNSGTEELIKYLQSKNLPVGIISRNRLRSILRALENFEFVSPSDFKVIVSRDDQVELKPDPAGILLAARKMGVQVEEMLVVGDFHFDIEAGRKAGAVTVFLTNGAAPPRFLFPPDYVITHLRELQDIVRNLHPLSAGKLPGDLLEQFLQEHSLDDPSILVRPGLGEDAAAVQLEEDGEVIVLTSDPITFTTDRLGYYTVLINANDVATCGAVPRWLLTTLLLPLGSSAAQIHQLMQELQQVSREFGLSLCGGHTEITDAVNKPVVVGQLVGTVPRDGLIDKRQMAEGDQILLTKAVAVEGTSIIAREFPQALKTLGISEHEIERCQQFLVDPGISILKDAQIAAGTGSVSAMHDVTEGGVATALEELSAAGRHRLRVHIDQIPVFPETRKLCRLLDLSPLGLIGSGSLLVACKPEVCKKLVSDLREAGIQVSRIGEVLEEGVGIEAVSQKDRPVEWPRFEVDEISRAIQKMGTS